MSSGMPEGSLTGRLSALVQALQEGFGKLSRSAGVKELAAQFCGIVGRSFPGATLHILAGPGPSGPWTSFEGPGTLGIESLLRPPPGEGSRSWTAQETPETIAVVQRLVDRSFVALVLKPGPAGIPFAPDDAVLLRVFVHLYENAHQEMLNRQKEKNLVFSLNQRLLQLNSLIDTGIEVARLDQHEMPAQLALERATSLTNAAHGVLRVERAGHLVRETAFPDGAPASAAAGGDSRISTGFAFAGETYTFELYEKESRTGVIPFEGTDQLLLDALARQVHGSLENRYLHEQALEKQKIEQEMTVAASIQQRIIPASLPGINGYDLAGINIPSKQVGGDYYDCIPLPDGRYAIVMADVSGKGVPAALLVSSFHAYLAAYLEDTTQLPELAVKLNRAICRASTSDRFITASFALLSPRDGSLESLNAGHPPAYLLRRDGSVQELAEGGVALGMLDMDFPYQSERVVLGPGDRLLLYTDGIPEAANGAGEFYQQNSSLAEYALQPREGGAGAFIQDLIGDIRKFTGNASQSDDITALYLMRLP